MAFATVDSFSHAVVFVFRRTATGPPPNKGLRYWLFSQPVQCPLALMAKIYLKKKKKKTCRRARRAHPRGPSSTLTHSRRRSRVLRAPRRIQDPTRRISALLARSESCRRHRVVAGRGAPPPPLTGDALGQRCRVPRRRSLSTQG